MKSRAAAAFGAGKVPEIVANPSSSAWLGPDRKFRRGRFSWSRAGCGEAPLGDAKSRPQVPGIVDWYMSGRINIDDLITHTLPLEKINEGLRPHA